MNNLTHKTNKQGPRLKLWLELSPKLRLELSMWNSEIAVPEGEKTSFRAKSRSGLVNELQMEAIAKDLRMTKSRIGPRLRTLHQE